MAPQDRRLSDDWEDLGDDLGDDNLSVISFSSSEGEPSPAPAAPAGPEPEPETSAEVPNTPLPAAEEKAETLPRPDSPVQDDPYGIYHRDSDYSPCISGELSPKVQNDGKEASIETNASSSVKGKETVETAAAEPPEDPFRDPSDATYDGGEEDDEDAADSIKEIIDDGSRDLDPVYLSKTLQSLVDIINDTLRVVRETPVLGQELTSPSMNICKELQSQLSRIRPILEGYVRARKEGSKIPLDAGLQEWLSGVRVKVLGLLAETQRLGREPYLPQSHRQGPSVPWYVDVYGKRSELERIWDELVEFKNCMCEFLPILEADYNEFHTQWLHFRKARSPSGHGTVRPSVAQRFRSDACPPYVDTVHPNTLESTQRESYLGDSSQQPPRRPEKSPAVPIDIPRRGHFYSGRPPPPTQGLPDAFSTLSVEDPSDRIWRLRCDMYQLKDALQAALDRLHFTASNKDVPLALSEWAAVLGSRYDCLLRQVTIVVSNHASDWIESIANGGLTYREFIKLEDDALSMYTAQLAEIVGERNNTRNLFRTELYPRNARAFKGPELNGDELEVMEVIVNEMELKFKVNTAADTSN
ncbi:hypothetical protein B0T14DRAFT_500795 [Immersiella caudata]|uniref:Uncharacterized protein n=1 Tax=Immersiella caudata TaxID=314043 RepID=A0AA39TT43_9PEZI|nr:hypothetical protein B0T14DRAFT_500795 [Immersiella caudata]